MPVVLLRVRAVDPIQNVQATVGTHAKDVVTSQVLHFSVTLQDNQLGQNGHRLQVNGKGPKQLHDAKIRNARSNHMGKGGKNKTWGRSKLPVQKGILTLVVSALDWFLEFDSVDNTRRRANVHHFHNRIVNGVVGSEQIQVTSDKDHEKELM